MKCVNAKILSTKIGKISYIFETAVFTFERKVCTLNPRNYFCALLWSSELYQFILVSFNPQALSDKWTRALVHSPPPKKNIYM